MIYYCIHTNIYVILQSKHKKKKVKKMLFILDTYSNDLNEWTSVEKGFFKADAFQEPKKGDFVQELIAEKFIAIYVGF